MPSMFPNATFETNSFCFRVSHAYNNQKRIDVEGKKLENNSINLGKQADQWAAMVETFTTAVKVRLN